MPESFFKFWVQGFSTLLREKTSAKEIFKETQFCRIHFYTEGKANSY